MKNCLTNKDLENLPPAINTLPSPKLLVMRILGLRNKLGRAFITMIDTFSPPYTQVDNFSEFDIVPPGYGMNCVNQFFSVGRDFLQIDIRPTDEEVEVCFVGDSTWAEGEPRDEIFNDNWNEDRTIHSHVAGSVTPHAPDLDNNGHICYEELTEGLTF